MHLRASPLTAGLPRWPKDSPEFRGFCNDILANGIRHPLLVDRHNAVIDGWTRREGAVAVRLAEVPCLEVPDNEINGVFVREIVRRRNLTKGQRAFLVAPFLQEAFTESLRRRSSNASKTNTTESYSFGIPNKNVVEWAGEMGFSHDLLYQAQKLHEIFNKDPKIDAKFRPLILDPDNPIGLGAALAGIAGKDVDQDHREFGVLTNAFNGFLKSREFWASLSKQERAEVEDKLSAAAGELPRDMRAMIARVMEGAR